MNGCYYNDENDLEKYLKSRIKSVDECYKKELPLMNIGEGHEVINVSGLTKKEKDEVINKRNCLIVQKLCYEEILEFMQNTINYGWKG